MSYNGIVLHVMPLYDLTVLRYKKLNWALKQTVKIMSQYAPRIRITHKHNVYGLFWFIVICYKYDYRNLPDWNILHDNTINIDKYFTDLCDLFTSYWTELVKSRVQRHLCSVCSGQVAEGRWPVQCSHGSCPMCLLSSM